MIECAVSSRVEPMPPLVARGRLDGSGGVVGGEVASSGESTWAGVTRAEYPRVWITLEAGAGPDSSRTVIFDS
jgi:hypothetical protein